MKTDHTDSDRTMKDLLYNNVLADRQAFAQEPIERTELVDEQHITQAWKPRSGPARIEAYFMAALTGLCANANPALTHHLQNTGADGLAAAAWRIAADAVNTAPGC